MERAEKWYEDKPDALTEKYFGDTNIQCHQVTEARRPNIVIIKKVEKEVRIIGLAVQNDKWVKDWKDSEISFVKG